MIYAIFEFASGVIRSVVHGSHDDAVANCPDGCGILELSLDALGAIGSSYVEAGVLVAMPSKPTPEHVFDYVTKQWLDPRTLSDHQASKWTEIKAARTAAEFGPFTYNSMVFDGDVDAQRRLGVYISVAKSALAQGTSFQADFTLADNTQVTLTAQDFVEIEMAKVAQVASAFAHAVTLRALIEAQDATINSVESVTW